MSKWQPIETAPKDGTPIVLLRENKDDSFDRRQFMCAFHDEEGWRYVYGPCFVNDPTHWMPLTPIAIPT